MNTFRKTFEMTLISMKMKKVPIFVTAMFKIYMKCEEEQN